MIRCAPLLLSLVSCALTFACKTTSSSPADIAVAGVQAADGVLIHYRVAGTQYRDPTIVFVHGFGCDSTIFDSALAHVAERARAVAIDLPGHGQSGSNRVNWTMEAYGDDVRRVCDAIGTGQVVLVGHSMGGPVILEAAREMSGRVLALIPVETFHDVDVVRTQKQVDEFVDVWRKDFKKSSEAMIRSSFHQPLRDPKQVDAVIAKMNAMQKDVGLALLDAMFRYDVGAGLEDITLPIRCINSGDRPTNLAAGRRHAKRFDARLVPGVGHYLMVEDPEAFNALLDAAIDELTR